MLSNHHYLGISCSEACSVWARAKLQAPRGQHNHSLNSCTIYCEQKFILTSHRDRSNFVGGPWRAALSVLLAPIWPQILKQHPHKASNVHRPLLSRGLWFISPLSFEDLWIAARVKQIKVQNLHSCHSEAVHIYTAPPYLWLGCFPGKWKFELIKTEHSTDTSHSTLYFMAKGCNTRTLPKDRQGWQRVPVFSGTGFGELSVWVDARCACGHQGLLAAPSQVPTYWREGPVTTEHCNLSLPLDNAGNCCTWLWRLDSSLKSDT